MSLKRFSEQQTDAVKRIIFNFDGASSVILVAQMQSGKSDTYYFVAFEFIRTKRVNHVVIVLGFSDKELVGQTTDFSSSWALYDAYMEETIGICRDERNAVKELVDASLKVKHSAELAKQVHSEFNDTLFIWDESHYAQNKVNRPFKFMQALGVPVNGDETLLEKRNNFVLSVSATPYSEISDLVHEGQKKGLVKMTPGEGYIGVKEFYTKKKIIGVEDWKSKLPELFLEQKKSPIPKYSIIRVHGDSAAAAIKIAIAAEIGYEVYDGEQRALTKKTRDDTKMQSLDDLKNAPSAHKCVIIKGMLRMGKRLAKMHISFVMETSKQSNTDVILQGLLGRVCGYHTNSDICIYVSDKMFEMSGEGAQMNELERFIEMMEVGSDDVTTMPTRATNIMGGAVKAGDWDMAMPIVVPPQPKPTRDEKNDEDAKEYKMEKLKKFIVAHILNGTAKNSNASEETRQLVNQLGSILDKNLNVHKINKNKTTENLTFSKMPDLLRDSVSSGIPLVNIPPGCGFKLNDDTVIINVWEFNTDKHRDIGFPIGTLIVCGRTKPALKQRIPKTTGREAFTIRQEDECVVEGNGAYTIHAPVDTWHSIASMQTHLINMLKVSRMEFDRRTMPRCITSNQVEGNKWKGIIVSSSVLEALEKNGTIYNHMLKEYGEKLKIKKQRGKTPEDLAEAGQVRLTKIEW